MLKSYHQQPLLSSHHHNICMSVSNYQSLWLHKITVNTIRTSCNDSYGKYHMCRDLYFVESKSGRICGIFLLIIKISFPLSHYFFQGLKFRSQQASMKSMNFMSLENFRTYSNSF